MRSNRFLACRVCIWPLPNRYAALAFVLVVALLRPVHLSAQAACLTPAQALGSLGQPACVEGVVTNAFYARQSNGQPTFLDMGAQFTAVIWGDDRPAFNPPPESRRGQRIRVTGVVSEYRGKAQIVVREPSQLGPAGGPPPLLTPARTRTPTTTRTPEAPARTPSAATIPPTVETAVSSASPTVEAAATEAATQPAAVQSTAEPDLAVAGATARPSAAAGEVATAVSRARVDAARAAEPAPSWMMVAGGLGLVAVGAGGALVLTRRRSRDD